MHRLEAFFFTDFDNQMATFHCFCAKLDLNMDHHLSPHGSPIPKRSALPKVMKWIVSRTWLPSHGSRCSRRLAGLFPPLSWLKYHQRLPAALSLAAAELLLARRIFPS